MVCVWPSMLWVPHNPRASFLITYWISGGALPRVNMLKSPFKVCRSNSAVNCRLPHICMIILWKANPTNLYITDNFCYR